MYLRKSVRNRCRSYVRGFCNSIDYITQYCTGHLDRLRHHGVILRASLDTYPSVVYVVQTPRIHCDQCCLSSHTNVALELWISSHWMLAEMSADRFSQFDYSSSTRRPLKPVGRTATSNASTSDLFSSLRYSATKGNSWTYEWGGGGKLRSHHLGSHNRRHNPGTK